ncbi:MAG TPA: hypothetical protein VM582_04465 [Candidatus Thermoplasmatota archaeon]|nr:hypothetical protein [Candidatus Thermoplasmatota archaeon]
MGSPTIARDVLAKALLTAVQAALLLAAALVLLVRHFAVARLPADGAEWVETLLLSSAFAALGAPAAASALLLARRAAPRAARRLQLAVGAGLLLFLAVYAGLTEMRLFHYWVAYVQLAALALCALLLASAPRAGAAR